VPNEPHVQLVPRAVSPGVHNQAVNMSIHCVWCRDQERVLLAVPPQPYGISEARRVVAVGWGTALQDGWSRFVSRCCLILTQPGILSEEQRRPVRRADKLTTFVCRLSRKLGTLNSWNPMGCNGPVQGLLYRFTFNSISKKYYCRKNCLAAGFIWCYPKNLTFKKFAPLMGFSRKLSQCW
jgi:hypothetical protein